MDKRSGRVLRDRRLELGLTQEQVALEAGIERYNTHRPHTTLQYKTPQQVEADFQVAARK